MGLLIMLAMRTALVTMRDTRSWGGHHHDAVHGDGLEHREGHVAGSGGHVDEQVVQLAPTHVGPELLDHAGQEAAPPDHGVPLFSSRRFREITSIPRR